MKAVIMAGGEGTRIRPLTCNYPKPMVPLANKPVMEYIVELLKKNNLTDIGVTLQYMPDAIRDYFGDGQEFGVHMKYFVEEKPLGTAGSIKNTGSFLDDTFLVISGDALTDIDLGKAIQYHNEKKSQATLILKKVDIPLEYGIVVIDEEGRITRFLEKPSWGEVFSDTVNTGIYILSPNVMEKVNPGEVFDFSKDLFPVLLKENVPMYGYVTEDYWCDIGDLGAYIQSHADILDGRVRIRLKGQQTSPGIWMEEGASVDKDATVQSPCILGRNVKIKKGAFVGSYSIIGENTILQEQVGLKRAIIWKNCILDWNVQLRGSIICNKVHLKGNTSAFENTVVGDESVIQDNVILKQNIKIWPGKTIEAGTTVNSNLVWGSKCTKSIFGNRGITGEINVDITPEFASKLGAAYGAMLKGKGKAGISCDFSNAAQMLKISFISGLLSSGIEVYDFGEMLLPATRSAIRFYRMDGGIHISTSVENDARLFVDFLSQNGSNIDRGTERKIENIFVREDFSRCEGDCIHRIKTFHDYADFYLRSIINSVSSPKLLYKVVVNSPSGVIAQTVSRLLTELGCTVDIMNLQLMNTKTHRQSKSSGDVRYFASHVQMSGFDLGVSIEDASEKMMLVDTKGRIITEDMFIALISIIVFKTVRGGTVVVPISASGIVEKIASENDGKVIRTKTSSQDLMAKILGSENKEGMMEQFTMHFDALAGLARILDFMQLNGYSLSELVDMIPEFHMDKKEVACSWDAKGKVIREIIQKNQRNKMETLEGVKIYDDNGWVLVLPDAEKPVCRIISESSSAEFAEELSAMYADKIRQISADTYSGGFGASN